MEQKSAALQRRPGSSDASPAGSFAWAMGAAGAHPLALILAAAFTVRLLLIIFFVSSIDGEGAEYCRIAETLLAGGGYVGISTPGAQLFQPALYPLLIAAVGAVIGDVELAARLITAVMGALLTLPVFAIANRLFGRAADYIAAVLVAVEPALAQYSATAFCEPTYLTLIFSAVYWSLPVREQAGWRSSALAGLLFGLAYLVRPDAAAIAAIAFALLVVRGAAARSSVRACAHLLLIPAVFAVCAAPQVAWLYANTHQIRLEGKAPLNLEVSRRMLAGEPMAQASFAVTPDLRPVGVWNTPNADNIVNSHFGLAEVASQMLARAREIIKAAIVAVFATPAMGTPLLTLLAALGLWRGPWSRDHVLTNALFAAMMGLAVASTFLIYYSSPRFYLVFLPVFCIWGARGVIVIAAYARRWVDEAWARAATVAGVAAILAAIAPIGHVYDFGSLRAESRVIAATGRWIDAHAPGQKTVLDLTTMIAFHAKATSIRYPYCDEACAYRYMDNLNGPVFIVVRESYGAERPYLMGWIINGIPNERAHLVYEARSAGGDQVRVYDWASSAIPNAP